MTLKVFYSDRYTVSLPEGHRFPIQKYRMVRLALLREGMLLEEELFEPSLATREMITLAHTAEYFDAIYNGTIDPAAMRRIGFPWSRELVMRSLASVGGTVCAAEEALENGISGNLAGGTHHALADAGEGYCVFNDMAVAALYLLKRGSIRRAAIVDLDVHQGNGNAAILSSRPDVFVFSMHGAKNYPFQKIPSTLDIDLPDETDDASYLSRLREALPNVLAFDPDIVFYQAGVDPLKEDTLGRLSLSKEGLAERDRIVLSACKRYQIPIALALGGGYAKPIDLTVDAHVGTYKMVKRVF